MEEVAVEESPLWVPKDTQNTNISKFIEEVNSRFALDIKSYDELHDWSVGAASFQQFWSAAYGFLRLSSSALPPQDAEIRPDLLCPPPRFFASQKFNFAEMVFRDRVDDALAIREAREDLTYGSKTRDHSWADLRRRTEAARGAMLSAGLQKGDRVAAVVCNSTDAIILCLAALSIGGIWSSASCEMGAAAIIDRFEQIQPTLVFANIDYVYAQRLHVLEDRIATWSHELCTRHEQLKHIVVLPSVHRPRADISKVCRGIAYSGFLSQGAARPMSFATTLFCDPAFIMYSSGTTGKPKCIVHSGGGVMLKARVDAVLQHDIRTTDTVFQYTTTGWIMWLLNLANLTTASSMLLYEGSPFHPKPTISLDLCSSMGVTVLGISPKYLSELKNGGIVPRMHALQKLRIVTSTGAVLSSDQYRWFYREAFPSHVHLISMSGGTDIAGCFVGGSPLLPVYAGQIQAKCLGMAVEIFDTAQSPAKPIVTPGKPGELVCVRPFPSQPLHFWGPDGQLSYRRAYFKMLGERVWCQGDDVQYCAGTGGLFIVGRSDGTLNPAGVRFGSAEIYSVTEALPELVDAICVGQRLPGLADETVLLFVKLLPGNSLDAALIKKIRDAIRNKYSPRHVPARVLQVPDIPYTASGKKCEVVVKKIVNGDARMIASLVANSECLPHFRQCIAMSRL